MCIRFCLMPMGCGRTIFAHGFVKGEDGLKMSKSIGNVVDPVLYTHIYKYTHIYLSIYLYTFIHIYISSMHSIQRTWRS